MALQRYFLSLVIMIGVMLTPITSYAQIVTLPDCNETPNHFFCQGQCTFDPTLPWCPQPSPSPSPSPTPTNDPIVLVPPLIASYNKKLMKKDEPGGQLDFVFGGNTFRALINKLENAGYEMNKNLFIAHYDWRQSNIISAEQYLLPVIQQAKQETGASKVDLIAHSMGGLVARSYLQGNNYANDVNQLITLGTPHTGASGAYQAWEGGQYPETWNSFIRFHIDRMEAALKKTRNMKSATRPSTFRTFFPSLRDLLPIDALVTREGNTISIPDLAEQNPLLQNLRNTFNLISDRGVSLATIGAKDQPTLKNVSLINNRTVEDADRLRWRDGHANPDPPTANSTDGDTTVLLSSAHVGSNNTTLTGTDHMNLPEKAQDEVLALLGLAEVEEHFEYQPPKKLFGITIMSPLSAVIQGPNGQILSFNRNDFGNETAEYDDDPSDPDDPKDITILDPPDGKYTITYTGTGEGEYTIITTYADDDETISSTREGVTQTGQAETEVITIGNNTISLLDDTDYQALLKEIIALAKQAKKDNLIKGYDQANLTRPVTHALNDLRLYKLRTKQGRTDATLSRLQSYYEELNEIEQVADQLRNKDNCQDLAHEILQLVQKIKLYSPPLS